MKKIIIAIALILLFIPTKAQGATIIPNSYSHSYSLMIGEDAKLENDEVGTTKWISKNKKIAVVTKKGIVKAVGSGKTVVTANVNGKIIEYDIAVSKGSGAFIEKTVNSKGDAIDKAIYITKSKYNSLSYGNSYDDAAKIIGANGSLTSYVNDDANKIQTEVYTWIGEDGIGNASVIFVNGKITEKAEMFLD